MTLETASEFLCGRRLSGNVVAIRPSKEDPDQQTMFDESHTIAGSFDITQFSCKLTEFTGSISFARAEIGDEINYFASKRGQLRVTDTGDIPASKVSKDDGEDPDGD